MSRYLHVRSLFASAAILAVSLSISRSALAQSAAETEQTLAPMTMTGEPQHAIPTATDEDVTRAMRPVPAPIRAEQTFPRLRFGVGWEGTVAGGGYVIAGAAIGLRVDLGMRFNRWIGVYARASAATLFVFHAVHAAAMLEFYPHRIFSVSAGVGYVAYAYTPFCLFGGCDRSDGGVTVPIRFTILASRANDDHLGAGISYGVEFFAGSSVAENRGLIAGGSLFVGYSRM